MDACIMKSVSNARLALILSPEAITAISVSSADPYADRAKLIASHEALRAELLFAKVKLAQAYEDQAMGER